MSSPDGATTVSIDALHSFCMEILCDLGVSSAHAQVTSDALTLADSWGTFTHGTKLLIGYAQRLKRGGLRTDTEPQVVKEGPAWAIVDGQATLGQVVSTFAMTKAVELANKSGFGYVGVRNSCHFGAAGVYSSLAAKENMVGLSMANDVPSVAAPGSRTSITGTNPFSYAIPAGKHPPILLDMAISTVAGGKIYAAQQLGKEIPDNWLIGPDGKPTSDASLYPASACLAPMTAHKGYGLALMIESLSAIMTGASLTWNVGSWMFDDGTKPTNHGGCFIAMNVAAMQPLDKFLARVDGLIDEIHEAPKADGVERLYVPGEMEWERRQKALQDGIKLQADVVAQLRLVAKEYNIQPSWLQ